jgi:hypothetical protein
MCVIVYAICCTLRVTPVGDIQCLRTLCRCSSLSLSLGAGSVQNSHITDSTTSQVLDMSVRRLMDLWNSEAPETRQELGDIAKDLLLIVRESVHMFHFIHRKEVG